MSVVGKYQGEVKKIHEKEKMGTEQDDDQSFPILFPSFLSAIAHTIKASTYARSVKERALFSDNAI